MRIRLFSRAFLINGVIVVLLSALILCQSGRSNADPTDDQVITKPELRISLPENWTETNIKDARRAIQADLLAAELYAFETDLSTRNEDSDENADEDPAYLVLLRSKAGKFTQEELKSPRTLMLGGKFKNFSYDPKSKHLDFDFFSRYEGDFAQRGIGTFALTNDGAIILLLKAPADRYPDFKAEFHKIRQSLSVSADIAFPEETQESQLPMYIFWLTLAVVLALIKRKLTAAEPSV